MTPSSFSQHGASTREPFRVHELRRSRLAPLFRWLYRLFNCPRRLTIARYLLNVIIRFEGGAMRSATARELMSQFHGVAIGEYSYGCCFDPKTVPPGVSIGRYVSIGDGVRMFLRNHPLDRLSTHPFFYEKSPGIPESSDLPPGSLEIGSDVWIGCNALITPGCDRVGDGAVIGAGAVVTKNVPDFAIVAGNPAKVIRNRFSENAIERLQAAKWWLLSIEDVEARRVEFDGLLTASQVATPTATPDV